jgi:hypothetical protein
LIATTTDKTIPGELTASDSRRLIRIEVLETGPHTFQVTINEKPYHLPPNIPTIEDARKVAVELAIKEISSSSTELISKYLD